MSDSSDLRQVGQASLIYANDHDQHLPVATDVWDYARQLAAGLNDAREWASSLDPATQSIRHNLSTVLAADMVSVHPEFARLRPSIAVPLGALDTSMPATTPIAWTRGLLSDGTWAPHSPYGTQGGFIVFLGGNVQWYRDLRAPERQLMRFDGTGRTSNILEALPPGTRIGEYLPTPAEAAVLAAAPRYNPDHENWWWRLTGRLPTERDAAVLVLGAVALPFAVIGGLVWRSRRRGAARRPD